MTSKLETRQRLADELPATDWSKPSEQHQQVMSILEALVLEDGPHLTAGQRKEAAK
jgi:hypothetical protein